MIAACLPDPRPDLADDATAWDRLLRESFEHDGNDPSGCHARLRLLRCYGVRLERSGDTLKLTPRDDEENRAEFDDLARRYLAPRRDEIVSLLRAAA